MSLMILGCVSSTLLRNVSLRFLINEYTKSTEKTATKPSINAYFWQRLKNTCTSSTNITLKVATVIDDGDILRKDMVNVETLTCNVGILCWVYPKPKRNNSNIRELSCCLGLIEDLLVFIQDVLRIDIHLYEVHDGMYGAEINKSWTGLIGEVMDWKADLAGEALTVTEHRLEVADFTEPFLDGEIGIASKMQLAHLPIFNLEAFAVISEKAWLAIMSITIISFILICCTERLVCSKWTVYPWSHSILYTLGLLVQRDIGGVSPHHLGSRAVSVTIAIAMIIIITTYTAVLTARHIGVERKLPIEGLHDTKVRQMKPAFKYGTLRHSSYSELFDYTENPRWKKMGQFMNPYNYPSHPDALESLQNGSLDATIMSKWALNMEWRKPGSCNIQLAGKSFKFESYAFAAPRGSQWTAVISNLIRRFKENGMLNTLKKRWLTSLCLQADVSGVDQQAPFDILYLSGACIMLLGGSIVSLLILGLERVWEIISEHHLIRRAVTFVSLLRRNQGHYRVSHKEHPRRGRKASS